MKKLMHSLMVLLTISLLEGCCCSKVKPICQTQTIGELEKIGPNIDYSMDEIIVKVSDKIDVIDEQFLDNLDQIIVQVFGVKFQRISCPCGDKRRFLYKFDEDILNIETKVGGLGGSSGNQVEGERQFSFNLPEEGGTLAVQNNSSLPKYDDEKRYGKVNIAVLDTGLDLSHFDQLNLFPNPPGVDCNEGKSGWNFVGNNGDISDDHAGVGHGTLVTKTITSLLDDQDDYTILPIKVFDKNGQGTYWDIVCAMSFLNKVQEKSGNAISIVNASFGGSLGLLQEESTSSLKEEIDRLKSTAIVVTSAGNCHFNTDNHFFRHYPSGYSSENIIAVGGFDKVDDRIIVHDSSNYGRKNIDLATPFQYKLVLTSPLGGTEQKELSGTSYSAAYLTSNLAKHMLSLSGQIPQPIQLKNDFLANHTMIESGHFKRCIRKGRYIE